MLFIFLPILFILSTHWLIYDFVKRVFNIKKKNMTIVVGFIFLILAFSFIASAVLVRFYENGFTRILYFGSALWFGVWWNLILAIAVVWLITLLLSLFRVDFNFSILGGIALVVVLVYSGFGIYNVFNPQIRNIKVEIKNLPENWQNKKIVQLTDVHLGSVLRPNFLEKIVKEVNAQEPDLILITGDLFDGMANKLDGFIPVLNTLEARQGVYYVNGNHEIYLGLERALAVLEKTKIKILDDTVVNIDGLQIAGVSYSISNQSRQIVEVLEERGLASSTPSILMYHAPTSLSTSNGHGSMYWSPQIDFSVEQELGIDLQLSGHTHQGQIFPLNFLTKWMYKGYDYDLHQLGDFQIYTSSGTGIWGPVMRTGSKSEITVINLI